MNRHLTERRGLLEYELNQLEDMKVRASDRNFNAGLAIGFIDHILVPTYVFFKKHGVTIMLGLALVGLVTFMYMAAIKTPDVYFSPATNKPVYALTDKGTVTDSDQLKKIVSKSYNFHWSKPED